MPAKSLPDKINALSVPTVFNLLPCNNSTLSKNRFAKRISATIVTAQMIAAQLILLSPSRGDEDNRCITDLAKFLAQRKPVYLWQHDIQQYQVILPLDNPFKPFFTIIGTMHLKHILYLRSQIVCEKICKSSSINKI